MQISRDQAEKLKRYLINADPFLWGILGAKNKKQRLKELKNDGLLLDYSEGSNATYSKINQDLLVELGIEGILERVVVPRIGSVFSPDVLSYFRRCWDQGQNPDMKYLVDQRLCRRWRLTADSIQEREGFQFDAAGFGPTYRVVGHKDPAHIFVQIDTQHSFVERWTVFAGLWFEEIEPLLETMPEGTT